MIKTPSVQLVDVTKEFKEVETKEGFAAVDRVNLEIGAGEFFTILGPSGCGKSTTLRLIAGFETPTQGRVLINGADCSTLPPYKRPVHTVFQNYALFPHMTVNQNVGYSLTVKRVSKNEREHEVQEALAMVQLGKYGKRKPNQLSGGQQQRVALARALVNNPSVLLLDEPLGALDLKLRKEMQWELKQLQKRLGITFVYVTHDQDEALTMSDRIAVMSEGKVIQVGAPEEIYDRPNSYFVADFIGETNFIKAKVVRVEGNEASVIAAGEMVLARVTENTSGVAGDKILAVRPEKLSILSAQQKLKAGYSFEGKVLGRSFAGADVRYEIVLASGEKISVLSRANGYQGSAAALYSEGDQVRVSFNAGDAFLLTL
jgi:spermidine/putrescine transport system ATP-binding protein